MTRSDIRDLIQNTKQKDWKKFFSDNEWELIVFGLYDEYKQFSTNDMEFNMYYQNGIQKLLLNGGNEILKSRFLC